MRLLSPILLAVAMLGAANIAQAGPMLPAVVATAEQYESASIGYGSAPSELHAAFWRFAAATPTAALLPLLAHQNPVVRAYAAVYLAAERPAAVGALRPVFRDDSRIRAMEGCTGGTTSIWSPVLGTLLLRLRHRSVQDFLLSELKENESLRAQQVKIASLLLPYRAPEVVPFLRDLVSRPDPASRSSATRLFVAFSGLPAATPLSRFAATFPWLGALLLDPSTDVRDAAIQAAGNMYQNRPDEVPALLQSRDPAVRRIAIYGLGEAASERSLPMLAHHFARHPGDIPDDDSRPFAVTDRSTANHVEFMRAMLAVPNRRRHVVIRRLHKFRDLQSVSAIRPFLRSPAAQERLEAIRAAGGLSDALAAQDLLPLLASTSHDERLATAQALADLCLPQHASALRAAVAREPGATAPALQQSLERLLRCPPSASPREPAQPAAASAAPSATR